MNNHGAVRALQGKTALVTGASSGIGQACAQVLAQDGATVLIVGRNPDALARARAEILQRATDARIELFAGDACEEDVVERALERAYALSNRLDILVPTVGGPEYKPVLELDAAGFRRQFELNCVSAFLMVRHGAPLMAAGGAIVCISTAAVGQANMGLSAYAASKAALERFVRAAAFELGPAGIRINAVRPGATLSPEAIEARGLQRMAELYAAETPLGRIGKPLDVARAVRFLAGPEGAWVTGETISADGGMQQGKAPDLGKVI
jgi:NAD(P)-dependent dehydrogenase (short-subunit alcohol dehydrogenase family)